MYSVSGSMNIEMGCTEGAFETGDSVMRVLVEGSTDDNSVVDSVLGNNMYHIPVSINCDTSKNIRIQSCYYYLLIMRHAPAP